MLKEKILYYYMEISKSKMARKQTQEKGIRKRLEEERAMITINKHGKMHYRKECENCCCIFEYDKTDTRGCIEKGKRIFEIKCPECGTIIEIEGDNNAGN